MKAARGDSSPAETGPAKDSGCDRSEYVLEMADCRECESAMPDDANFCPSCGAPQNEAAAKALEKYARRKAKELSVVEHPPDSEPTTAADDSLGLTDRFSYALGWLIVVAGLALVPHVASGFVVFGGIVALPPLRRLLGRALGYTPEVGPMLLISLTSVGIGVGLFFVA